ncbi:MAG: ABC transporter permease, partial [Thermostichales cyanobacterium GMQP_bins_62]
AIYRRELQSYFASPFAYLIAGVFWLLSGFFFMAILLGEQGLIAQAALRDQLGITDPPIDVAYQFLSFFLGVLGSLSLFVLPMLSMGLYSEERKRGTLELLATSPITNWAVALGKLLGVVTFFVSMVLPLLIYQGIALGAADPPVRPDVLIVGHVGLILMAAAILSLGMFVSSLTDSTILAAILTFALILLLWVIDAAAGQSSSGWDPILRYLSILQQYGNWVQGSLTTSSVIFFLSMIGLGIFLTVQAVEGLRWQRS